MEGGEDPRSKGEGSSAGDARHSAALEALVGALISAVEEKPQSFFGRKGRIGVTIDRGRSLLSVRLGR